MAILTDDAARLTLSQQSGVVKEVLEEYRNGNLIWQETEKKTTSGLGSVLITTNRFRQIESTIFYGKTIVSNQAFFHNNSKWSLNAAPIIDLSMMNLKGNGSVRDEYDIITGKFTMRYKILDMGSLSWKYRSANNMFYADLPSEYKRFSSSVVCTGLCERYSPIDYNHLANGRFALGNYYANGVHIIDTAFTSATTFKAAMQGVKLLYELTTPVEKYLAVQPMWSMNWVYDAANARFYSTTLASLIYSESASVSAILMNNAGYTPIIHNNLQGSNNVISVNASKYVYVRDSRFTNANDFKAYLNGKYLAYALANPTDQTIYRQSISQRKGPFILMQTSGDVADSECKVEHYSYKYAPTPVPPAPVGITVTMPSNFQKVMHINSSDEPTWNGEDFIKVQSNDPSSEYRNMMFAANNFEANVISVRTTDFLGAGGGTPSGLDGDGIAVALEYSVDGGVHHFTYLSGDGWTLDNEDDPTYAEWDLIGTLATGSTLTIHGVSSAACLVTGTHILMANRTIKRIEDIARGDLVLALAEDGSIMSSKVLNTIKSNPSEYDIWVFSDGSVIKTIGQHRFLHKETGTMDYLQDIPIGDHIYLFDGSDVELISTRHSEELVEAYTLLTEGNNYVTENGMVSGNRATYPIKFK